MIRIKEMNIDFLCHHSTLVQWMKRLSVAVAKTWKEWLCYQFLKIPQILAFILLLSNVI